MRVIFIVIMALWLFEARATAQSSGEEILRTAMEQSGLVPQRNMQGIPELPTDNLGSALATFAEKMKASAGAIEDAEATFQLGRKNDSVIVRWSRKTISARHRNEIVISSGSPPSFVLATTALDDTAAYAVADPKSGVAAHAIVDRGIGPLPRAITCAVGGSGDENMIAKGGNADASSAVVAMAYGGDSAAASEGGTATARGEDDGDALAYGGRGGPHGGVGGRAEANCSGAGEADAIGGDARGGGSEGGRAIANSAKGDAGAIGGAGGTASGTDGGPGGVARSVADKRAWARGGPGGSGARGGPGGKARAVGTGEVKATGGDGAPGYQGGAGGWAEAISNTGLTEARGGAGGLGLIFGGPGGHAEAVAPYGHALAYGGWGGSGGYNGRGGDGGNAGALSYLTASAHGGSGGSALSMYGTGGSGGSVMGGTVTQRWPDDADDHRKGDPATMKKRLTLVPGAAGPGYFLGVAGGRQELVRPLPYIPEVW